MQFVEQPMKAVGDDNGRRHRHRQPGRQRGFRCCWRLRTRKQRARKQHDRRKRHSRPP